MNSVLERFTSPLDIDAYLSTISPLWGTRLRGVVERVDAQTASAASLTIRPGRSWKGHTPGQFVTVGVDIDGVRHHRCYSLTSRPDDCCIEITVQASGRGLVSDHLVHRARPGDVVQLSQAEGDFTLQPRLHRPLLLVTGGSGITPAVGMLRALADRPRNADVVLLHHAVTADRLLFAAELERWSKDLPWLQIATSLTRQGGAHLDTDRLAVECPDWREREVYACGPQSLLDVVVDHWAQARLADRVHLERFTADLGSASVPASAAGGVARFAASGVEADAGPATSLLEVAEAAGLAPAHGCRMGICHTCTTRLDRGCVRDLRDGRLSEPGAHVQLCVSAAAGDVTLDL